MTGYSVEVRSHTSGTDPKLKSRMPGGEYAWARKRAFEILYSEGAWWEPTDMDPASDALLDRIRNEPDLRPGRRDVTGAAIRDAVSAKHPEKDDLVYARCAIPFVVALREGMSKGDAIDAAHASLKIDGHFYDRGTVKDDIAEAKRRGLDKAAADVIESGGDLTPATVVACSRGNKVAYPNSESEELLREAGIERPVGSWAGWEEPGHSNDDRTKRE